MRLFVPTTLFARTQKKKKKSNWPKKYERNYGEEIARNRWKKMETRQLDLATAGMASNFEVGGNKLSSGFSVVALQCQRKDVLCS